MFIYMDLFTHCMTGVQSYEAQGGILSLFHLAPNGVAFLDPVA